MNHPVDSVGSNKLFVSNNSSTVQWKNDLEEDPNPFQARILALSTKLYYLYRLNNSFFSLVMPLMQRRDRMLAAFAAVDGNGLGKTCFLPIDSAVTRWKRYSQQVSSFAWPSSRRARFLPAIRQLGNNPVTSRGRVLCSALLLYVNPYVSLSLVRLSRSFARGGLMFQSTKEPCKITSSASRRARLLDETEPADLVTSV